jgi:transcriptional regulator with GAF, ATPase, and Fis domain
MVFQTKIINLACGMQRGFPGFFFLWKMNMNISELEHMDIGFVSGRSSEGFAEGENIGQHADLLPAFDDFQDGQPIEINPALFLEAAFEDISARIDRETEFSLTEAIKAMERTILVRTLVAVGGNKKKASRILGLKYTTLFEKIRVHGIQMRRVARGPTCWEIDIQ